MFAAFRRGHRRPQFLHLAILVSVLAANSTLADDHEVADEALHFSHPLVSESPSPDTKLRVDYELTKESAEQDALVHRTRLEADTRPFAG
jgi:hypothetical protein